VFWAAKYLSLAHLLLAKKKQFIYLAYPDAAIAILFQMLCVYTVCGFLFKRFFLQKKYGWFVLYSALSIVLTSFVAVVVKDFYTRWFFIPGFHSRYAIVFLGAGLECVYVTLLFLAVYLAAHYYQKDRLNRQLEKKQLEAEVNFLKAQLNPHFIFNSLNSIYVLMDEDVKGARETLLMFCSLLRYQLYDCSEPEIPVSKELKFINDIIDLEKVRFGEKLNITFNTQDINDDLKIAPLLLIPYVENAFKHLAFKPGKASRIDINAELRSGMFIFRVENDFNPNQKNTASPSGIGLQNVKRRFELLYPGRHRLHITQQDERFIIHLTLDLNETEMPHSR
jgi:sensor histidine kinase YesM